LFILELSGAISHVHDPDIIKDGDTYYLFSTGQGIQIRASKDLKAWLGAGQVFASKPSWIITTDPNDPNNLWAPEVLYFGGTFHLYYAASKFGSNKSCIGHATKDSLGSATPWVDLGATYCSNAIGPAQDFNAIDPNPFQDEDGKLWLGFGSFWSGLKLIRIDGGGLMDGPDMFSLATRSNTAVEAPHLQYHDGFYFLFESVDACCQGSASTYKIMVGRSADVAGPYVDRDGSLLGDGGGTLVLQGAGRWRGPGHNAILHDGDRYWNVYHSYDADNDGVPTLRISELTWSDDNWPVSAGP
jgi:arabinan endo-1,5-alpha-L-arabinosidase